MTASTIKRLLDAKPFVPFRMYCGYEVEFEISDPKQCRIDEENSAFYVSYSSSSPPAFLKKLNVPPSPAFVEVLDLRQVYRIQVDSGDLPE